MQDQQKPNAAAVFDECIKASKLKNDAELARHLGVHPPMISAMRAGRLTFGNAIQAKIVMYCPVSARKLRKLMDS